jgi:hypothetical protein
MAGDEDQQITTTTCIICGDVGASPASTALSCTRNTAIEFLHKFDVLSDSKTSAKVEYLCAACFDLVASCDQWEYLLSNGVEQLKTRLAGFLGKQEDSLNVKFESGERGAEVCILSQA